MQVKSPRAVSAVIQAIPENRMADGGEVKSQLVGAPSDRLKSEVGIHFSLLLKPPQCLRWLASVVIYASQRAFTPIASDRKVDFA